MQKMVGSCHGYRWRLNLLATHFRLILSCRMLRRLCEILCLCSSRWYVHFNLWWWPCGSWGGENQDSWLSRLLAKESGNQTLLSENPKVSSAVDVVTYSSMVHALKPANLIGLGLRGLRWWQLSWWRRLYWRLSRNALSSFVFQTQRCIHFD